MLGLALGNAAFKRSVSNAGIIWALLPVRTYGSKLIAYFSIKIILIGYAETDCFESGKLYEGLQHYTISGEECQFWNILPARLLPVKLEDMNLRRDR